MRNIYMFAIAVIFLPVFSCNKEKVISEDITLIKINNLDQCKGKTVSIQEIGNEISFINLITPSGIPLADINKLIEFNGMIYIGDQRQKTIFVFDENGKFIRKIGQYGKGPGEIVDLTDFHINPHDSCIIISDIGKREILKFGKKGQFFSSTKTKLINRCILTISHQRVATYSGFSSEYDLVIADTNFIAKRNMFPVESHLRYAPINRTPQVLSYDNESNVLFLPAYSNYVYSITNEEARAKYLIDFCDNNLPDSYIKNNFNGNSKEIFNFYSRHLASTDYAYSPFSFIDNNEHIYFKFIYDERRLYNCIVFKNDNYNNIVTNSWSLDKNGRVKLFGQMLNLHNGCLIGSMSQEHVFKSIKKLSNKEQEELFKEIPSLKKLYNKNYLNDNPVIIKIKLK